MDFKVKYIFQNLKIIMPFIFVLSCVNTKTSGSKQISNAILGDSALLKQRQLLKEYAVCRCLTLKFPDDTSFSNDGSTVGLIEISNYSKDAYDTIDSFLNKSYINYNYTSKEKNKLYLMQCADLYYNKSLDSLVKQMDKLINW